MWCLTFDRKSTAPQAAISGVDRRRGRPVDKIRNLEKFFFGKYLVRPLPRQQPELHARLTKGILNIFPPMWWGLWGLVVHHFKSG